MGKLWLYYGDLVPEANVLRTYYLTSINQVSEL